jgi:viroplasmin and RNaseH domain-containing protein
MGHILSANINYNKTEEAKKYAADEYGGAEISQDEVQSKSTQSSSQSSGGQDSNPLSDFFKSIFTNQVLKTGLAVV